MSKNIFITGIGTNIGKTVCSAVLCQATGYQYWKPIQCGDLDLTDSHKVQDWCPHATVLPERYSLQTPASPHYAAEVEAVNINLLDFEKPTKSTIIEGAGGLLVPINEQHTMADMACHLADDLVIVASNYLGSINHTLLTISHAKTLPINLLGVIFSGERNLASEQIILNKTKVKCLGYVDYADEVNAEFILKQREKFVSL